MLSLAFRISYSRDTRRRRNDHVTKQSYDDTWQNPENYPKKGAMARCRSRSRGCCCARICLALLPRNASMRTIRLSPWSEAVQIEQIDEVLCSRRVRLDRLYGRLHILRRPYLNRHSPVLREPYGHFDLNVKVCPNPISKSICVLLSAASMG